MKSTTDHKFSKSLLNTKNVKKHGKFLKFDL